MRNELAFVHKLAPARYLLCILTGSSHLSSPQHGIRSRTRRCAVAWQLHTLRAMRCTVLPALAQWTPLTTDSSSWHVCRAVSTDIRILTQPIDC